MDYTFKKSTCERYDIRWDKFGWATITIDENGGMFNAQSDYGSYAYSWPNHGRESFKHFILELARDASYFLGKVSRETYYDHAKSLEQWKKQIIEIRRDGECTREQARDAWEFLDELDDYCGNATAVQMRLYESSELSAICAEPWCLFCTDMDYPPAARYFANEVMPMFAEILKNEIAEIEKSA